MPSIPAEHVPGRRIPGRAEAGELAGTVLGACLAEADHTPPHPAQSGLQIRAAPGFRSLYDLLDAARMLTVMGTIEA